jgi:hypothetical protein
VQYFFYLKIGIGRDQCSGINIKRKLYCKNADKRGFIRNKKDILREDLHYSIMEFYCTTTVSGPATLNTWHLHSPVLIRKAASADAFSFVPSKKIVVGRIVNSFLYVSSMIQYRPSVPFGNYEP